MTLIQRTPCDGERAQLSHWAMLKHGHTPSALASSLCPPPAPSPKASRRPWRACLSSTLLVSGLLLSGLAGCKSKETPKEEPVVKTEPSARKPNKSEPIPEGLKGDLVRIVRGCQFNTKHAVITRCSKNEKSKLVREFRSGKRDRVAALPELMSALKSDDPKLQTTAARVLHGGFRQNLGKNLPEGAVSKELATEFINLIPKLDKALASAAVVAAVHTANVAGETTALYAMLDAHPDKHLRAAAYAQLAVHGGAAALPKLRELMNTKDENLAAAAMRNGTLLGKQPDEVIKPFCEFALEYLADPRHLVALRAGQMAASCGEAATDQLLEDLSRRHKDGKAHPGFARSVEGVCGKGHPAGTPAQCKTIRDLFEKVVDDTRHSDIVRSEALVQLGMQFNDAGVQKLVDKYKDSDRKKLKAASEKARRRLEWQSKRKGSHPTVANRALKPAPAKATAPHPAIPKPPVTKPAASN